MDYFLLRIISGEKILEVITVNLLDLTRCAWAKLIINRNKVIKITQGETISFPMYFSDNVDGLLKIKHRSFIFRIVCCRMYHVSLIKNGFRIIQVFLKPTEVFCISFSDKRYKRYKDIKILLIVFRMEILYICLALISKSWDNGACGYSNFRRHNKILFSISVRNWCKVLMQLMIYDRLNIPKN